MKYSTDLLYNLARSVPSVDLDGTESQLLVPPVLHVVSQIPGALSDIAGFLGTTVLRDSFVRDTSLTRTNQASTEATVCTFGRGLWLVKAGISIHANFTQLADGTEAGNTLLIRDPVGTGEIILKGFAINAVPQHVRDDFLFLFSRDGWILGLNIGAAGVGQSVEMTCTVHANRLV